MAEVHYKDGEHGPYVVEVADEHAEQFAREVGGGVGALPADPSSDALPPVEVKIEDGTKVPGETPADGSTPAATGK